MSDPDLRPLREIEDELRTLGAHLSAGMARWLELLWEFDVRSGFPPGFGSCAAWLAWRCGLDLRTAREHVRVARALHALPLIRGAFARGELSYAKVRALTRAERPVNEDELLELAKELTASQLERALSACRRVSAVEADKVHHREGLSCAWAEDGSLVVQARLAPENGALLMRALDVAQERLCRSHGESGSDTGEEPGRGSAEPSSQPRWPTRVEGLVAVAESSLAHASGRTDGERTGADRCQLVVHVDEAVLASTGSGICVLENGPPLAADTARRLACDSSFVALINRNGEPLKLGRKTRTISAALRRALKVRDRCCRFPGCTNTLRLEAHHVEHWASGGKTDLENLLRLCPGHHRLVHEGGYTIAPDGTFRDPEGELVPDVPELPCGELDELLGEHGQLEIGPETCKGGRGERIDFRRVVDVMNQAIRRYRSYPRPMLIWRATEEPPLGPFGKPIWPPNGRTWIDTVDEHGNVLATEVLLENSTPNDAFTLALERSLDYDLDDGHGFVDHRYSVLRQPGPCPQPLIRPETPLWAMT